MVFYVVTLFSCCDLFICISNFTSFIYLFIFVFNYFHMNGQVANFGSAEDDGSFWSRWIKPEAVAQAEV